MIRCNAVCLVTVVSILAIVSTQIIKCSQPVLQKTVKSLFSERIETVHSGACKWIRSSARQTKMCTRDRGLQEVLVTAKEQALSACEESFKYDRWNCSFVFNNKPKRNIFNNIFRETAFAFSLIAASLSHAVAKGCASGTLIKCSCVTGFGDKEWKNVGCGDDFKYGKQITRHFLELKNAGTDQIAEVLRQNVLVGIETVGAQLREVCKCHGFSGSCTTKTCWKRLTPFNSAMGLLKKHYHHAVKKKMINYTTKRAITPKLRKRIQLDRKNLVYLKKTPNLCVSTVGRTCKDRQNCATLCCGRGFMKYQRKVDTRCKCKMVNCCYVKCDTCKEIVDFYVCK